VSGPSTTAAHAAALQAAAIPPLARAALIAYLDLLAAWAPRMNLTGATDAPARVRILVLEAAALAPHLASGALLDVGSGNGSPGLVLAALRPDIRITLLEPRQRRWAFLREATRAMGREDVVVQRGRHDEYRGEAVDTVTLRALALPLGAFTPLVRVGGRVIVIGLQPPSDPQFEKEPTPGLPATTHVFRRCST
jgi:16S rRNA (guanine527-N7)-methyltransferase